MRNSSPPSVLSSIVKGGNFDLFNMVNSLTNTSMSPVGILSFLDTRSITFPLTCTTNSRPKFLAFSNRALSVRSASNTNCVIPYLSRKSIHIIKPLSRIFCTHPDKATSWFTFANLNAPL